MGTCLASEVYGECRPIPLRWLILISTFRYKMSWFEASARVPLMISYPKRFSPGYIQEHVSTLDILPTLVGLIGGKLDHRLPLDGRSLVPQLQGHRGIDMVVGEYMGEGTIAPVMMIRRGPWKFMCCPTDPTQLFNLDYDPKELINLATSEDPMVKQVHDSFLREAEERWDFKRIHAEVLKSQRTRRVCWDALRQGRFESWDYQPRHDVRDQYIRSTIPLDALELRARYPPVDAMGRERPRGSAKGIAGAFNQ